MADIQPILSEFPEFGEGVMAYYGSMDELAQGGMNKLMAQAVNLYKAGRIEDAKALIDQYSEAAGNSGNEALAASAKATADMLETDPDTSIALLGSTLAVTDPDLAKKVFGISGARVQSSNLIGGRVSVQTMSDGSTRVVDTSTGEILSGDDALKAIQEAEEAEIELTGAKAGGRKAASLEAAVEGGEAAKAAESLGGARDDFFKAATEGASNALSSISNIQSAIDAIDSGAKAGPIYRRIPDITKASAQLNNAMNRMGLDVIGSVTFGALNQGELRLAMETAAPRNLPAPELRKWLQEKLDAQKKLRAALIEQSQFLADPNNSLSDWSRAIGVGGDDSDPLARF